jgi:hypothetical protein
MGQNMPLDRISEEIAHFIGLFHLHIEENRLRLEYEAFSLKRDEVEPEPGQLPELVVAAPYSLKGFDPGLVYQAAPATTAPDYNLPDTPPADAPPSPAQLPQPERVAPEVEIDQAWPWTSWQFTLPPFVPLPNAILVSIRQTSELWDNDLLLVTGETEFVDPEALIAEFLQLIDLARDLGALGPEGAAIDTVPQVETALALAARIAAVAPDEGAAEVQLLLRGEAAQGNYVNGEQVEPAVAGQGDADGAGDSASGEKNDAEDPEILPDFVDLLPAHLAEKHAEREAEAEAEKDALAIPPDGTTDAPESKYSIDPGHKVVTGANIATNETAIVQAWVDAPVIAVAGDAIRLDVVSQVNVMVGAAASFGGTAALPSQMLNAVSVEYESAVDPEDPPPPASPGVFPEDWTVVSVAADVFAVNWVKQYIFATDFDRAEIAISAAATYIGTGENAIGNGVRLVELGFNYDLIMVGGSMITMNVIDQFNVLLDVDVVGGAPASPVGLQSGDNLQYNRAELKQTGRDEMTALQDNFRTALQEMAEGTKTLAREVAQDARFEGKAALRVLQIEGDLIKANIIEQHNFLGDSDQVQLMLDDFLAAGQPVQLVTGSNAQLNAARIHDIGLDSEVMVGGEAYSDALIYQAQLLDPDAPPTGVGLMPLASEAVAFLADDMLGAGPDDGPVLAATVPEHPASSDLLHAIIT